MKKILIIIIKTYKKCISPIFKFLGINCKYYPTCSEYMIQAIKKYGCIRGSLKGIKRIIKCNPFSKGRSGFIRIGRKTMFSFFANIFGYLLNFLYNLVSNYGLAIIIFSVLIKIILLPISIKQQKTMKKSAKMQAEMKEIQCKYKENPEKMNQEILELYRREKMSPFSGCLSAIVQIVLLLSIFYLVRSPLTYMKKVDTNIINSYIDEIKAEGKMQNSNYPEIEVIKQKGQTDEDVNINMEFLGLDLSDIPTADLRDYRVYIIPILYVISSIISMKMTSNMQTNQNKENGNKEDDPSLEAINNANKTMSYTLPVMSVMIAFVAPLGLALYWLVNNILMVIERVFLNIFLKEKEEE